MMTISPIRKSEFLRALGARRLPGVNLAVAQAIVERINATLGVAFAHYSDEQDAEHHRKTYAGLSGHYRRTVLRTITGMSSHGALKKRARRNGPPALWIPDLMDMDAAEAVRRVEWIVRHRGEDDSAYFCGGGAKVGTPSAPGGAKVGTSGGARIGTYNTISNNSSLREEAPQSRGGAEAKRGTHLPEDWRPSPQDRAFAKQVGLSDGEIDAAAKNFWRHWTAEAGSRAVKRNWSRIWEGWIERDCERRNSAHRPRPPEPPPGPRTFTNEDWRNNRDVILKYGGSWPEAHWGPPPGHPDCLMPEPLQLELGLNGDAAKAGAA
jgi:hypothetical protein